MEGSRQAGEGEGISNPHLLKGIAKSVNGGSKINLCWYDQHDFESAVFAVVD